MLYYNGISVERNPVQRIPFSMCKTDAASLGRATDLSVYRPGAGRGLDLGLWIGELKGKLQAARLCPVPVLSGLVPELGVAGPLAQPG